MVARALRCPKQTQDLKILRILTEEALQFLWRLVKALHMMVHDGKLYSCKTLGSSPNLKSDESRIFRGGLIPLP